MSYRIHPTEPVQDEVRRVAHEQLAKAIDEIDGDALDLHETVHKVRVRCKKIRALVRLVRKRFDGYADANRALRDAARRVSDLRDAQSDVTALASLRERRDPVLEEGALAPIAERVRARRDERAVHGEELLVGLRADLVRVDDQVDGWSLDDDGLDAIVGGLEKTYRRARQRMTDAYDAWAVEGFHEWRKRVKYHRYHVRLLKELWRAPLDARRRELHELTDLLGDAHDCAELRTTLAVLGLDEEEPEATHALDAFLAQRWRELNEQARPLGERAFLEPPEEHLARISGLWGIAA